MKKIYFLVIILTSLTLHGCATIQPMEPSLDLPETHKSINNPNEIKILKQKIDLLRIDMTEREAYAILQTNPYTSNTTISSRNYRPWRFTQWAYFLNNSKMIFIYFNNGRLSSITK